MTTEVTASRNTVEGRTEVLVNDLKRVVGDADEVLQEVANSTAEGFAAARTQVEGKLSEARSRLDDARIAVTRTACRAADATDAYVSENPWKVLGIAALAGFITGFVLSRVTDHRNGINS